MSGNSILTLEQRLDKLQKAKERAKSQASKTAKIQKVAHHLRNREHFAKHYSPKLMSFGPIHHGTPKLQLGEQYKEMWAAKYIDSTEQNPQVLHKKIVDNIENLKSLFDDDLLTGSAQSYEKQGFRSMDAMICWMLFMDGCALLQILGNANLEKPEEMFVKIDQLVLVMLDVLLLENQLPYLLLQLLWKDTESKLMETMKEYLWCHHWATRAEDKVNLDTLFPPTHLLDLQRSIILYDPSKKNETQNDPYQNTSNKGNHTQNDPNQEDTKKENQIQNDPNQNTKKESQTENYPKDNSNDMVTYRNIKELKEAGIGLKSSKTRRPRDVSFSYGWIRSELKLPEIVVDDTTAPTVLNLIAYEMCPDFENDYGICSYVSFLDSLIDHPDDVKALRSKQILLNSLGSDEEVANLFNTLSTDLVPNMRKYAVVRAGIEKHYSDQGRTWLALGYHSYFSNPWAIIAFHAAVIGLAVTFIQTWYTMHPPK